MNPMDYEHVVLWWGPGVLVLIAFGWGFFHLAQYWIEKSMEAKRQQMDGAYGLVRQYIEKFLGAQSGQADALARLANSVEHHESQESFEHQEILIALKALHQDMNRLRCRSTDELCALRSKAGLGGRYGCSPESSQEFNSPACSSLCDPSEGAAAGDLEPTPDPFHLEVEGKKGPSLVPPDAVPRERGTPSPTSGVRWSDPNRS